MTDRVNIKRKWIQGNQLVIKSVMTYGNVTKEVTSSCSLELAKNTPQFLSFLEDCWEANRPRNGTEAIDLSMIPDKI